MVKDQVTWISQALEEEKDEQRVKMHRAYVQLFKPALWWIEGKLENYCKTMDKVYSDLKRLGDLYGENNNYKAQDLLKMLFEFAGDFIESYK